MSTDMIEFCNNEGILLNSSLNYYPQGNGLAESTKKNIIKILKRKVNENQWDWHTKLFIALWANRIILKVGLGCSPYTIIYGKNVILLINLQILTSILDLQ